MKKDQFVIACVDSPADAATVLPWARHFAERLNHKGLMVLHIASHKGDDSWLNSLGVPYVSMQGDWRTAIEGLPTAFNGILAVAAVDPTAPRTALAHPRTLLRHFHNCKTAYLCIRADAKDKAPDLQKTAVLTLTHRREGKEKLVWASYMARFLGCRLLLAHPDYGDEDLRRRWQNNMRFVDKMFTPFHIDHEAPVLTRSTRVDLTALEQLHPDLLIAMTTDTRDRDIVDWLLPLPELVLLTHPSRTPLLLLNPRDDLYVLCD